MSQGIATELNVCSGSATLEGSICLTQWSSYIIFYTCLSIMQIIKLPVLAMTAVWRLLCSPHKGVTSSR